jgi:hypothetical protein
MTILWLRHQSGRSCKVVKLDNNWLSFYFEKDELTAYSKQPFKTKKEATRSGQYWLETNLID